MCHAFAQLNERFAQEVAAFDGSVAMYLAGKVRHMPLKYALSEYKGRRDKLLERLSCLNRVAEVAPLIAEFMEKSELFHPLRLRAKEAYQILKCVPDIEAAGIVCRIPNWWRRHAYGVSATVVLGEEIAASGSGWHLFKRAGDTGSAGTE